MHISKIRIRNYKSFLDSGEIVIDKSLFALIGQNNTGKSAVLDAIQCIFPSTKKSICISDFHKGSTNDVQIEIWFDEVTDKYIEETIFVDKIFKQIERVEELKKGLDERFSEGTKKNLEKQILKIDEIRRENLESNMNKYKINENKMYIKLVAKHGKNISTKFYVDGEIEVKETDLKQILPQVKVIPAIRDPKNESTAGANSYLKELIQMLDDEIQTNIVIEGNSISYKELNSVIAEETKNRCKSLGEKITEFYNKAIGTNDYKVIIDSDVNISKGTTYNTKIKDINTGIESDILNCGTGYQSMIILSILEAYVKVSSKKSKYILLIEEPEVYLHPLLQRKMIDTLIIISQSNQVIFTSHSPITVSKLEKRQVKLVKKISGSATIEDVVPKLVIDELGIKADDIIANKGIIFVEGKDDKRIFDILLDKIEEGLSSKINVLDVGSCDNLKFYANAEVLINSRFNVPTLIVRDSDTKEQEVRRETFIAEILNNRKEIGDEIKEKIRKSVRVTDQYSIEGYFIDEELLKCVLECKLDDLKDAVKCYECQYKHYSQEVYAGREKGNILSSWYQPKYFLEKFLDKFNVTQKALIEEHNKRYKKQWLSFAKCEQCVERKIENFFEIRESINSYSKGLKLKGKDLMVECINEKDLNELKKSKLAGIIGMLEEFNNSL
ncbi:AAA family ATPase [Clostridium sp. MSJ-11]|uniref:AAA family ATPase n=1 Tax=Clostridium mobile TaxID=2841512 RepID=A0ABS6EHT6_9CLOT|nr:AAA family ATPase [Clostridium mobile]MBU5484271.1 AAA family ATPase [Clostridium mobile]